MQLDSWENLIESIEIDHPIFYLKTLATVWGVEINSIAEIGVYQGVSSIAFRRLFPNATLYLVDAWEIYDEYRDFAARPMSQEQDDYDRAFQEVQRLFAKDPKVKIIQKTSLEAAPLVPNGLDLVFIDANHSYEYVKQDIELWAPKVRSSAIVSGHDYHPIMNLPVVHAVNGYFGWENVVSGPGQAWATRKK